MNDRSASDTSLFRLDLVRRHWITYVTLSIATLAIHWLVVHRFGLSTSTDFAVRYDPGARALLNALGIGDGAGAEPIGTYGWSRLGYIGVVALSYATWGIGNWAALLYSQLAVVWLLYPLMFHILLHVTDRYLVSVVAIVVWLSFLDGYQWHTWALPDALYRLMFVAAFFLLLRLWQTHRSTAFLVATVIGSVIGITFRLETVLYAVPAYLICLRILYREHPRVLVGAIAAGVAGAWGGRAVIASLYHFWSAASEGLIFSGLGYHIDGVTRLAPPATPTVMAWTQYYLHLYLARLWYSVTPFPLFWSRSHQMYYALYVITSYVLIGFGLRHPEVRRSGVFQVCLFIFAAGVFVRLMLHVDPPLRYAYMPQALQFMAAVLGWQAVMPAWQAWRGRPVPAPAG